MMNLKPMPSKPASRAGEFIGYLFHLRNQAHVYHLQTRSFAQHKALDEFYSTIVDLADGLAEAYQGKYDLIKGYSTYGYKEDGNPLSCMQECLNYVNENRYTIFKKEDTNIQNDIDTIVSLIESTIYKLKFLG